MKQVKLIVKGRVQGVNFRFMVKNYCDREGLAGRVENLDNGDVEIIACGIEWKLRELIKWVKSSPGMSRVDEVAERWGECSEKVKGFKIRRDGGLIGDKMRGVKNLGKKLLR